MNMNQQDLKNILQTGAMMVMIILILWFTRDNPEVGRTLLRLP